MAEFIRIVHARGTIPNQELLARRASTAEPSRSISSLVSLLCRARSLARSDDRVAHPLHLTTVLVCPVPLWRASPTRRPSSISSSSSPSDGVPTSTVSPGAPTLLGLSVSCRGMLD